MYKKTNTKQPKIFLLIAKYIGNCSSLPTRYAKYTLNFWVSNTKMV